VTDTHPDGRRDSGHPAKGTYFAGGYPAGPVWRMHIAGGPAAPDHACLRAAAALDGLGLGAMAPDTLLLLGELVGNAAVHAPGPIRLQIMPHSRTGLLYCEVADTSPRPPSPRAATMGYPAGRGLWLIEALATSHGWFPTAEGKAVWFTYPLVAA
jgi:hypothetical protein